MPESFEWLIDAHRCDPQALADLSKMQSVCDRAVRELGLHVVGEPRWHQFPPPGGVTGLYLLSESHLSCHTFPEHGLATFNLYCCRLLDQWPWEQRLADMIAARQVVARAVVRGAAPDGRAVRSAADRFVLPSAAGPRRRRS